MEAESRKRFQFIIALLLVLLFVRLVVIFYQRHEAAKPAEKKTSYSSNMDDYVIPPKIHPYDVKSAAKELVGKTVWVRAGNAVHYYPFSAATHTADLKHEKGLLPPLAKLQVKDVASQKTPAGNLAEGQVAVVQKQVLAAFQLGDEPGTYAVPIGTSTGDDFNFTANNLFFFADPHELYKHWPPETWQAIDNHQAKPGMNEIQVSMALGTVATGSGEYGNRTLEFDNNGHPVTVTFANNKATSVTEEQPAPAPAK
jgi:hypothetical protein